MTAQLGKAADCAQGMLEDLQCAERIIRHLTHQLEVTGTLTIENSPLDSLVANALEISCSGGEWIKDVIARASEEVEELYSATQNAKTENVLRTSVEVRP